MFLRKEYKQHSHPGSIVLSNMLTIQLLKKLLVLNVKNMLLTNVHFLWIIVLENIVLRLASLT